MTGHLSLRITDGGYEGQRKSVKDTQTRRLEDGLNKFIMVLIDAAQGSKRERLEAEERQREWEEKRRRWREEEERRLREEARIKELDSLVATWRKCENIRAFIAAVEKSASLKEEGNDPESDLEAWLVWARKRADSSDPLVTWRPKTQDF